MRLAYHLYIKVVEFYKVKLHYDGDGESFTMYKWGIMYMMYFFKNYSLEHNKTKECENLIFGDDLKFWSFFKMNIKFIKTMYTFLISYLFNNKQHTKNWWLGKI